MSEITLKEAKRILAEIDARAKPKYSTNETVRRGERVYAKIKAELEAKHKGKFAAIEVDSGEVFVDTNSVKASLKARKKYPAAIFYLVRIGYPAAFSMKSPVPLL